MILPQHPNEDVDADVVDEVAEEEELQVVTSVKQTGHQEEIVLKLSHHVTRAWNPLYHPRLKPKLYQPQAQAVPLPPVIPIGMHNVLLVVGQSGHPPNAELFYGSLVPQNDEDRLLSGRQPTLVMYNRMIQKCFTCDLKYDPNFMCVPHNMVIRSKTRRWMIINGHRI